MSIFTSKNLICGLLFLLTLISGLWLSRSGKPFNGMIFTMHKLIALGTVIVIGMNLYHLYRAVEARTLVVLSVIVASGLLFLALFVSGALLSLIDGALLSLERPAPEAILKVHQIAPLLALASSTVTLYLLALSKS